MATERLIHPDVEQTVPGLLIKFTDFEHYGDFLQRELVELGPRQNNLKGFILMTCEQAEAILPGFNTTDYLFGALLTTHLIRKSRNAYGGLLPVLSDQIVKDSMEQQMQNLSHGREAFFTWVRNEAKTLVPAVVDFLETLSEIPLETYWGITDIAQMYNRQLEFDSN